MRALLQLALLITLFSFSCCTNRKEKSIEKWKNEIIKTESDFAEMARKEGIPKAFVTFAADDAVLLRSNNLIIGKKAIQENYNNKELKNISLTWKPDFVDVASSGDMGYTYGKYIYTSTDSIGKTKIVKGIFHTVWKKQANGKWRFVWD